jgi:hypothetical protein
MISLAVALWHHTCVKCGGNCMVAHRLLAPTHLLLPCCGVTCICLRILHITYYSSCCRLLTCQNQSQLPLH